ncbi:hypothetical protein EBX31_03420 [bacterium]|nr:hypothetical protein [bacterium]
MLTVCVLEDVPMLIVDVFEELFAMLSVVLCASILSTNKFVPVIVEAIMLSIFAFAPVTFVNIISVVTTEVNEPVFAINPFAILRLSMLAKPLVTIVDALMLVPVKETNVPVES